MRVIYQAFQKIQNTLAYIQRDHRDYYQFGEFDNLLNQIVDIVNDSGTARACITKLTQFTQGNGLIDAALGANPANALQSWNSVISDFALLTAYFKAVAYRVMYNNQGQPAYIYPMMLPTLRRVSKSYFLYNDFYGTGKTYYKKNDDKYLHMFDKTESPQSRLARVKLQIEKYGEQIGDIVYHFKKGVGLHHDVYPVPDYYAGIDDIESDAGISRLEKRNIKKGWKTPIIISGSEIDDEVKDDQGKTDWDYFSADMKKFTSEDEENSAIALYLPGATNEAKPTVTTINIAEILDQTDRATDRIGRKVCRLMGVPPVLVGFATAGQLGNAQELKNTMDLFKMTVVENQDLIKEALRIVFPDKNWDITQLTLFETPITPTNEAAKV